MQPFTLELFDSFDSLKNFFTGQRELEEIRQLSSVQIGLSSPHLLLDRWQVAWLIIKAPFEIITAVFVNCLEQLFECVGAQNLAIRCAVLEHHLLYSVFLLFHLYRYGEDLLSPSINFHALGSDSLFLSSSLSMDSIQDAKVRALTFHMLFREVSFYHPKGACRGISFWFLYLYFQSQGAFSDPLAHAIAVAKQFEAGASEQAALLHSLCQTQKDLLDLDVQFNVTQISLEDGAEDSAEQIIRALEPGAYSIEMENHHIVYIKITETLEMLFDPSIGLIKRNGPAPAAKVLDYLKTLKQREHLNPVVCFDRTQLIYR